MVHVDIHVDSFDYILRLDSYLVKSNPIFPFGFHLTICGSSKIGVVESPFSTIEMQVGVPYDFDFLCKSLDPLDDEFLLVDSTIGVDLDLLIEFYLSEH